MTDRIAGWHRCWTNAQGRKALIDARDTGITFPLRLLARTDRVIEQNTAFVAVHVFSFGRHARGKLAMSALRGAAYGLSLLLGLPPATRGDPFFVPFRTSLLSNS